MRERERILLSAKIVDGRWEEYGAKCSIVMLVGEYLLTD
jgi:hypothetical protein